MEAMLALAALFGVGWLLTTQNTAPMTQEEEAFLKPEAMEAVEFNTITINPSFFAQKRLNPGPNQKLAASYVKTLTDLFEATGLLKGMVMKDALGGEDAASYKRAVDNLKAANSALSLDIGGIAKGAINTVLAVFSLPGEEEQRWAEAQACKQVWQFAMDKLGLPPTATFHYIAAKGLNANWSIIDGDGGFLRTKEPGPGAWTFWIRLRQMMEAEGIIDQNTPYLSGSEYQRMTRGNAARAVLDNDKGVLRVSRLASWETYVSHPQWLFIEPRDTKNNVFDWWSAYKSEMKGARDPFTMDKLKLSKIVNKCFANARYTERREIIPTLIAWKIGHDPASGNVPQALLGIVGGGSVTISRKSWEGKFLLYTNGGWMTNV